MFENQPKYKFGEKVYVLNFMWGWKIFSLTITKIDWIGTDPISKLDNYSYGGNESEKMFMESDITENKDEAIQKAMQILVEGHEKNINSFKEEVDNLS